VRQGLQVLGCGLLFGLAGAVGTGHLIESQLFGVRPSDPLTLACAVAAFALIGTAAIWWPSRRAASTDPAIALRAE
jgi:ABC-type antimicrobial peptide transport system permease subunit